jgi:hypothetical protein
MAQQMGDKKLPGYFDDAEAEDEINDIETQRLQGKITSQEANARRAKIQAELDDPAHVAVQLERHRLEGERLQAKEQAGHLRAQASEAEQYSQFADNAQKYEREQHEMAKQRMRGQQQGELAYELKAKSADEHLKKFRIADKRNVGERFFDSLAAVLGSIAAGPGGQNQALDQINKKLDREVAAQEAELDTRKGVAGAARNDLAAYRAAFQDKEDANNALRARYYGEQEQAIRSVAARTQSIKMRESLTGLADQFANRRLETETGLKLRSGMMYQQQQAAMRGQAKPKGQRVDLTSPMISVFGTDADQALFMHQAGGYARSKEVRDKLLADLNLNDQTRSNILEVLAKVNQPGAKIDPKIQAELQFATSAAVATLGAQQLKGSQTDPEFNRSMSDLGNHKLFSGSTITGSGKAALEYAAKHLEAAKQQLIERADVTPGLPPIPTSDENGKGGWLIRRQNQAVVEASQQQKAQGKVDANVQALIDQESGKP